MSSVRGQHMLLRVKSITLAFIRESLLAGIQEVLAYQARLRTGGLHRGKWCQSATWPLQSVAPLAKPKMSRIAPSGPLSVVGPVGPYQACVYFL